MTVHLILLGSLLATAYQPRPQYTKPSCTSRWSCTTATGENVSELGLAVSQDLLISGRVKYGDVVYVDGIGYRIVNDTMALKNHNAIDIFVYTKAEEKAVGVHRRKVWVLHTEVKP